MILISFVGWVGAAKPNLFFTQPHLAPTTPAVKLGPADFDPYDQIISLDPELAALTDPAALATGQRFDANVRMKVTQIVVFCFDNLVHCKRSIAEFSIGQPSCPNVFIGHPQP